MRDTFGIGAKHVSLVDLLVFLQSQKEAICDGDEERESQLDECIKILKFEQRSAFPPDDRADTKTWTISTEEIITQLLQNMSSWLENYNQDAYIHQDNTHKEVSASKKELHEDRKARLLQLKNRYQTLNSSKREAGLADTLIHSASLKHPSTSTSTSAFFPSVPPPTTDSMDGDADLQHESKSSPSSLNLDGGDLKYESFVQNNTNNDNYSSKQENFPQRHGNFATNRPHLLATRIETAESISLRHEGSSDISYKSERQVPEGLNPHDVVFIDSDRQQTNVFTSSLHETKNDDFASMDLQEYAAMKQMLSSPKASPSLLQDDDFMFEEPGDTWQEESSKPVMDTPPRRASIAKGSHPMLRASRFMSVSSIGSLPRMVPPSTSPNKILREHREVLGSLKVLLKEKNDILEQLYNIERKHGKEMSLKEAEIRMLYSLNDRLRQDFTFHSLSMAEVDIASISHLQSVKFANI